MKHCNKCDKDKDIKDFAKRTFKTKVGHSSWCKECSNSNRMKTYKNDFVREAAVRKELRHKYRKENITKAHKYLSEQGCKDCGEKDPIVLVTDHQNPTAVVNNVNAPNFLAFSGSQNLGFTVRLRLVT